MKQFMLFTHMPSNKQLNLRYLSKSANSTLKGLSGENFAISLYERARFQVIAHNVRMGRAQIDFIAVRQNCVHFVEVKYRKKLSGKHLELKRAQLVRIANAAHIYMQDYPSYNWQIDALLVDQNLNWQRIDNIQIPCIE